MNSPTERLHQGGEDHTELYGYCEQDGLAEVICKQRKTRKTPKNSLLNSCSLGYFDVKEKTFFAVVNKQNERGTLSEGIV
jgi:hypothetical protein